MPGESARAYHQERMRLKLERFARRAEWDFRARCLQSGEICESVCAGWRPLVVYLHGRLLEFDREYRLYALSERHGLLQYEAEVAAGAADAALRLISEAQVRAAMTCVVCGCKARLRLDRAQPRALCERCFSSDRVTAAAEGERYAQALLNYLASTDPRHPGPEETLAWLDGLAE
jgi:hypothetical protein